MISAFGIDHGDVSKGVNPEKMRSAYKSATGMRRDYLKHRYNAKLSGRLAGKPENAGNASTRRFLGDNDRQLARHKMIDIENQTHWRSRKKLP